MVCSSWKKIKGSTTGEPYIWLLVPDDVKTGADPEPAAQRVPQRACFPFLCLRDIFLPRGTSGSRLTGPRFQHRADVAHKFPVIRTNRGRWGTKPRPPASVFLTAFGLTFHTHPAEPLGGASPLSRRGLRPGGSMPDTVFWLPRLCLSPNLPLLDGAGPNPGQRASGAERSFAWPCFRGAEHIRVEVRRLALVPHRPQREGISQREMSTLVPQKPGGDGGTLIFSPRFLFNVPKRKRDRTGVHSARNHFSVGRVFYV